MSNAISGKNTVLIWNYHKVLERVLLSGPSESRDMIDMTHLNSPDGYKEFIAGLADGGEIGLDGNFVFEDELGQIAFHTDIQAGTKRDVFIVLPVGANAAVFLEGIANGFDPSFPDDDKISMSGKIKVTGKPVLLTSGSAGLSALVGIEENGGAALTIVPSPAAGTYAYTCTVNTASDWVKLTVTAASHTIHIQGSTVVSGVQSGEIALGAAGSTTVILIICQETDKAPRLYTLTVTRPS